jgi:hypothetical protein
MRCSWAKADYTSLFVDIEGSDKPAPLHDTKVKMLWDQEYFYIGGLVGGASSLGDLHGEGIHHFSRK